MDDRDVFLRAIDVLEVRGWTQGRYSEEPDGSGAVCLVGAFCLAAGCWGRVPRRDLFERLQRAIGQRGVTVWNDLSERTYEDVVLALKRAAHGESA